MPDYELLAAQVRALLGAETDPIANAANFAAFVYWELPDLNWAGFYYEDGRSLRLGPFCGRPACTRLPADAGVCAAALAQRRTLVVDDVRTFAGHIACDGSSRSEMAVPLAPAGSARAVFDCDSPRVGRFSPEDARGIELLVRTFARSERTVAAP